MLPLICLDVDGTLVGSAGEPTPELWEAAERARGRGQRLTLCTARLAAGPTRAWAERLDPDGWHVFHTGAARWKPSSAQVRTVPLPVGALEACTAVAAAQGWVVESYSWDDYVVDSDDPLAVAHAGLLGLPHRRRPVDDLADDVVRVQFVVTAADAEAAIAAAPAGTAASAATSPIMPGAVFVSVTAERVSKADGVAAVADDLGVPLSDVMMVGDGHNDLSAVEAVGWGVAMGNAEPALRDAARLVVADVDEDGAAQAIDASAGLGG
ncbi:MAG: HAD hydrolase family protein [Acidimicrobiales bacterium]|nr:HAD hydrolase family protein [Acidimicrobiales bacterium]HRW37881.1 HAD hydrolase family protein [Aquihabitans sp.]